MSRCFTPTDWPQKAILILADSCSSLPGVQDKGLGVLTLNPPHTSHLENLLAPASHKARVQPLLTTFTASQIPLAWSPTITLAPYTLVSTQQPKQTSKNLGQLIPPPPCVPSPPLVPPCCCQTLATSQHLPSVACWTVLRIPGTCTP
jgi:hypothetical protein